MFLGGARLRVGLDSKKDGTSSTDHVTVPGLRLVPDYLSVEEEETLFAVLAGPHDLWALHQATPTG